MGKIKNMWSRLSSKKMVIVLLIAVMIISGIIFMGYQSNQALVVKTVQLEKTDYEEYHFEEGTVMSKERMEVYSEGNGKIIDLFIKEGSEVNKGEPILNIDKGDLKKQLEILATNRDSLIGNINSEIKLQKEVVKIAKNKVASWEKELKRKRTLFESGAISKKDLEDIEYQYQQAVTELNSTNVQLRAIQEKLDDEGDKNQVYIKQLEEQIEEMKIVAPINGIISGFSLKKGDYVTENQLLFEIFQPDHLGIEAYVLAKEVKNLQIGMIAYIEVEAQNQTKTIKGKITSIAPNATELVSPLGLVEKKVKVMLELEGRENLIQGEKVDVKFITYRKEHAQVISKDYIFPWQDGEGMWIIDEEGKAKVIAINKAFDASTVVVLEDELDEKTAVIIPPYPDKIAEGVKVISK